MNINDKYHYRFEDLKENKGINQVEIILHDDDDMTIEYSGKKGFNTEGFDYPLFNRKEKDEETSWFLYRVEEIIDTEFELLDMLREPIAADEKQMTHIIKKQVEIYCFKE
ncbi:MAG: hypothetical protein BZ133_05110 [Methanosphaera sp. SHI613]|jgi:hypothetical protein|nr:MAG: hypothetical protein BZ133_05110 [Methanosphaera sp. SHI613]